MTPQRFQEVRSLFDRAVELPADQRDEWLRGEVGDDQALLREVRDLLAHDHSVTLIFPSIDRVAGTDPDASNRLRRSDLKLAMETTTKRGKHNGGLTGWLRNWLHILRHLSPSGHVALGMLIASLVLLTCALLVHRGLVTFRERLTTIALEQSIEANGAAVEFWLDREQARVIAWAGDPVLRRSIERLTALADQAGSDSPAMRLRQSADQDTLRARVSALAGPSIRYAVWDRRFITIADWSAEAIGVGDGVTPRGASLLAAVLDGLPKVAMLAEEDAITKDYPGQPGRPNLGHLVPVRADAGEGGDTGGDVIAALLIYDSASDRELERMIPFDRSEGGRAIYAFNSQALLLSESPHNDQLRKLGLIDPSPDSVSAKRIVLRDPGGDLTAGFRPSDPTDAWPLTKMARNATAKQGGMDVQGYRDYRGVSVVGAWRWLDRYEFGIATEIEKRAIKPSLAVLGLQLWSIIGVLVASLAATVYSLVALTRMRRQIDSRRRLGPYLVGRLIGEGGMGHVYEAQHELLKRPTAIKLLKPERVDDENLQRFTREARIAALLEHPASVTIFDYGTTPDGLFYLVMELLDGVTIDRLVQLQGPIEPARTVALIRQVCCSLREAHLKGLIHRDIKPQNIMVCSRGGEDDVVKVLDFGLAREIEPADAISLTAAGKVTGTPRYMAPERLSRSAPPSPAVDIYAVGCVVFFMLTGRDAIRGDSIEQVVHNVLDPSRQRPSEVTPRVIPKRLDDLVLACLSKEVNERPPSIEAVIDVLDAID